MSNHPIGIFDSGVGGTSIWKAIHDLLPNEDTIYLADSKNAPYGQKSKEEINQLKNDKLTTEIRHKKNSGTKRSIKRCKKNNSIT